MIKKINKKLLIISGINIVIFMIVNILFNIKYEQVDDFIIYNLYSGLDGTYNIHGIYIHPIICFVIGIFYRIIPIINWHTIFLLIAQYICFTIIGYTIIKKHDNGVSVIIYTIFASIFYSTLLMLIQYTSVAALLILTSFFLFFDKIETKEKISNKYKIMIFTLFMIGIMVRMQSLLIIIPFAIVYIIIKLLNYKKKKIEKSELKNIIKVYLIYLVITIIIYISNILIYNTNDVYNKYMQYNDIRATLHDIIYVDYEENKEIFDEIGWSKNDHYLFYTFDMGDENIYSKENLEKILEYKLQKDGKNLFNTDISSCIKNLLSEMIDTNTYISIIFISAFFINILYKNKIIENSFIFITTIAIHLLFIILGRSMLRVVIPEYILGTAILIYNFEFKKGIINDTLKNSIIIVSMIVIIAMFSGKKYEFGYDLDNYSNYREIIEYTNNHKENVYLYTVPSLQDRYLTYSVYQMPPKSAFSNLRVIGGWDMYTQNYYDFKERYELDGTLLDLLKENVYLIDGDVYWSGRRYSNYKENIMIAIKENYNIEVKCTEIKTFGNLSIYKLEEK